MRRRSWLLVTIALLGAAAFLMSRGDAPRREPQARVSFPRALRPAEAQRLEARRTLGERPAPEHVPAAEAPPGRMPPVLDPVLASLPAVPGRSAVVVEANALRHSPIGELLLDCLLTGGDARRLDEAREELGIDPLEDVDRVAFGGNGVLLVSGNFASAKWDALGEDVRTERYGDKARFFGRADHGGDALAVWGDELVLLADDRRELEQTIDRLEGRLPPAPPAIDESSTYGEIYGVISAEQLANLIPAQEQGLRDRVREAAERVELHVDATGDVGIVADVEGPQEALVRDLGKSLGAALSLARVKARAEGDDELVELLDLARVRPQAGRFALELALPLELLQRHLGGGCRAGDEVRATEAPE